MKWLLISEAYTPSNLDDIENSFNGDVSDEKYTPTKKFLKNGYDMLNEKLFNNRLPSDFEFKIEHGLKDNAAGLIHMPMIIKKRVNSSLMVYH